MNNQIEFLDILTIFSFILQLQNLEENREQSKDIDTILNEIQGHLHKQDEQYDEILELLKERI